MFLVVDMPFTHRYNCKLKVVKSLLFDFFLYYDSRNNDIKN